MPEIYSTNDLITVVRNAHVPSLFLKGRYFPTGAQDVFRTREVYVERKDDGRSAAPFVRRYSGGTLLAREEYKGEKLVPAFVNPVREMTIAQLEKKGLGEATIFDSETPEGIEKTPEEREQDYLVEDLADLTNACQRTWEMMCGQILTTGAVDATTADGEEVRFEYYDDQFDNLVTYSTTWADGGNVYDQIGEAASAIDGSYGALDLILGANLVKYFVRDETILKLLDVRNAGFGSLNPSDRTPDGVGTFGTINFDGRNLDVYSYNDTAKVNGTAKHYLDPDYFAIVPRQGFGAMKFGSYTQMEEDGQYHTYASDIVPRIVHDVASHHRTMEVASCPLPFPYMWDSWRACKAN